MGGHKPRTCECWAERCFIKSLSNYQSFSRTIPLGAVRIRVTRSRAVLGKGHKPRRTWPFFGSIFLWHRPQWNLDSGSDLKCTRNRYEITSCTYVRKFFVGLFWGCLGHFEAMWAIQFGGYAKYPNSCPRHLPSKAAPFPTQNGSLLQHCPLIPDNVVTNEILIFDGEVSKQIEYPSNTVHFPYLIEGFSQKHYRIINWWVLVSPCEILWAILGVCLRFSGDF